MALKGIRVIEFEGLAPVPFCGMLLADFGAEVIRIDRPQSSPISYAKNFCGRGKRSLCLDLKKKESKDIILKLFDQSDVIIDPYRPGVMEKFGIGPEVALKLNPKLIYARLTGYGQKGPMADKAGHDINYVAMSGVLSMFSRKGQLPVFPGNVLGDFAGGSLICVIGILIGIIERDKTGKGQVIDSSIVDGVTYLSTFLYRASKTPMWDKPSGENILDSGAPFYDVYKTKDQKYIAVGAIEPQFYKNLLRGLGLNEKELPHQMDRNNWEKLKSIFTNKILEKTQEEWINIFDNLDACVTPVLSLEQFINNKNTIERKLISREDYFPNPSPKLENMKVLNNSIPLDGEHTKEILAEIGYSENEIRELLKSEVAFTNIKSKL